MNRTIEDYIDLLNINEVNIKDIYSKYNPEQTSYRPSQTIWSIDDNLEHINMSEAGVIKLLSCDKPVIDLETAQDLPLRKLEKLEKLFTNRENKHKAPKIVSPRHEQSSKQLLETFENQRNDLNRFLPDRFPYLRKSAFRHPIFNNLVKEEWLYFICIHTDRHIQQMKEVIEVLPLVIHKNY